VKPRSDDTILSGYLREGRLRAIPSKRSRKLIVFRWLADKFSGDRRYTESEVNEILRVAHEDYATLRRDLCDYGFMQRRDGEYWRVDSPET
jgi:ArsR family transcriptional regulator, arsenate/arsenite/antimonite-responsive transcriptional repressor